MDDVDIERLLRLSQLSLNDCEKDALVTDLDQIIAFVDIMATVPTENIAPLSHPMDLEQPLRPDVVHTDTHREHLQASAPKVREGMYVVPRVVIR